MIRNKVLLCNYCMHLRCIKRIFFVSCRGSTNRQYTRYKVQLYVDTQKLHTYTRTRTHLHNPVQLSVAGLIENARRYNETCSVLLSDSPASEFYVPTFRNIKFRRLGVTQKKKQNRTSRIRRKFEIKNVLCSCRYSRQMQEL